MPRDETLTRERNEVAHELLEMLNFIQNLGHIPGCETHGETNESVYDINNMIYETRIKIQKFINKNSLDI